MVRCDHFLKEGIRRRVNSMTEARKKKKEMKTMIKLIHSLMVTRR